VAGATLLVPALRRLVEREETVPRLRPGDVNAALSHISATQLQADALRDALRNPPLPTQPKSPRRRLPRVPRLVVAYVSRSAA
jgi:hypothetical protein